MRLFMVLCLILCSVVVSAAELTIEWTAPNARENGTTLSVSDLGGYEIRYKNKVETVYHSVIIPDGKAVSYLMSNVDANDYMFSIAAFDMNGLYSEFVDVAVKVSAKPIAPPSFIVKQKAIDVLLACRAASPRCYVAVVGEWR